jgi:two-component system sensor histidine kinase PilS (NtrC family)
MSDSQENIVYPCPFSKGYGISIQQAWQLLYIYFIYRFMLASSLGTLRVFKIGPSLLGKLDIGLYVNTIWTYALTTLLFGFFIIWRKFKYSTLAQLFIFSDIILLTFLMHASGGITSGLGMLLAVSVAAGGLLIGGRCALVFAAIASLFTLGEEYYADVNKLFDSTHYTYAGLLGAAYFAIALLSVVMARRSEQMLQVTGIQQQAIVELEELNRYIIQNMQSGIIIADENNVIQMMNSAALRLMDKSTTPVHLNELSDSMLLAFQQWLLIPEHDSAMLRLTNNQEIQCRFIALPINNNVFTMITLEDVALHHQRVQQSKLASLGRLTASIAHEIRNPLSSISHAGQLLSENQALSATDLRLTHIIQTNSVRVNRIIEDILSLSKRNDSAKEKINLIQWVNEYFDNFYIENTSNSDLFELCVFGDNLYGYIDPNHLKQIFDNLCQNALRYGLPDKGKIQINILDSSQGPCLEVVDNGNGISQEHLKQLFEPFFTTSNNGTGLGLYISKELAELNQAKLSYYLTDDNRSCFRLCLKNANITTIEI